MKLKMKLKLVIRDGKWWLVIGAGYIPLGLVVFVDTRAALARAKDVVTGKKCGMCRGTREIKRDSAVVLCPRCCR